MPKTKTKKLALSGLLMTVLTVSIIFFIGDKEQISENSIAALKELNADYDMVMTDNLLNSEDNPQIMANIFKADQYSTENRGLIANTGEDMLLLQPLKEISDTELKEIAEKYNEKIPEIYFEIDQDVTITEDVTEIGAIIEESGTEEKVGDAIRIAVIDTGIQKDHPRFANTTIEIKDNSNVIDEDSDIDDDVGHGTHIAGIIAKNTPNSIIIPFKIVNKDGGKLSDIIKAIDLAINANAQVINMSLGVADESASLEEILEKATEQEIIIVAAAGNFSSSDEFYPAAYDETIAVAATYYSGKKLDSSNYGDWVDVAAKGYHVYSSIPDSDYGFKNGTSQAAAAVTAKIAELLSENPNMTKKDIMATFSQTDKFVKDEVLADTPVVS